MTRPARPLKPHPHPGPLFEGEGGFGRQSGKMGCGRPPTLASDDCRSALCEANAGNIPGSVRFFMPGLSVPATSFPSLSAVESSGPPAGYRAILAFAIDFFRVVGNMGRDYRLMRGCNCFDLFQAGADFFKCAEPIFCS